MMRRGPVFGIMLVYAALLGRSPAPAQEPAASPAPAPANVLQILEAHDRTLASELKTYIDRNPKAEDLDQAYMVLFERVIEHDWYNDYVAQARAYLAAQPDGAVAPLARIIATMARAQKQEFPEALAEYQTLMKGLSDPDQEEFASNFADSLARAVIAGGQAPLARKAYETLLERFGESPALRQKVEDELARIDLVGQPVPAVVAKTIDGAPLRLSDLRGKYVLVDFWATWCTPCVSDLPALRATYDRFHPKGLEIVSVSLDENPQAVSDFVRSRKIPWLQLHQGTCEADLVAAFKVGSIPASYLIAPDGTITRMNMEGKPLGEALEKLLP